MPLDGGPANANDALQGGASVGEALRAVRHDLGLSLIDLAEKTRVRRAYLEAIEEMRLGDLPSRPFTIGYIRAYALALGLDPEAAVDRFKVDEPVLDEPLRNPVGVADDRDPRLAAFVAAAIVVVVAIVLWNVGQRAMIASAPPSPTAPEALSWKLLAETKPLPMTLGKPLPAPVESTTPPLYETPGLAAAGPDGQGADSPSAGVHAPTAEEFDPSTLAPMFVAKGQIYGAATPQIPSLVTLQALKPAGLIVRGTGGQVYFARQLAAGEAYRVPHVQGVTVDVSEPRDIQVFVQGQSRGLLPSRQVLASRLAG